MSWERDLVAKARIWRDRPPSGKFIMHTIPRIRWCARCGGYVTKWHQHHTDDKNKGDAVIATSTWKE